LINDRLLDIHWANKSDGPANNCNCWRSLGETASTGRNPYKTSTNQPACYANATTRSYHLARTGRALTRPRGHVLEGLTVTTSCAHPAFVLRVCYATPPPCLLDWNAIPSSLLQSLRSLNRYRLFGLRQNQQTVCLQVG
jgi:hypothetical protein